MVTATIPFSAFRVPNGKIAVTLDLYGCDVFTGVIAAGDLEDSLQAIEQVFDLSATERYDVGTHVLLRETLKESVRQADQESREGCIGTGLWLMLNHPEHSNEVRVRVSRELRETGKAHLTIACDQRGMWGFSTSEKPVDLPRTMSFFPDGSAAIFIRDEPEPSSPSN